MELDTRSFAGAGSSRAERICQKHRLLLVLSVLVSPAILSAAERHIQCWIGRFGFTLYVAKSAGIFEKYGLDVDLLVIPGGLLEMQTLLSGNTNSANIAAMTLIRTVLAGGDM